MARWAAFAGLSVVSLLLLLALARASQSYVTDRPDDPDRSSTGHSGDADRSSVAAEGRSDVAEGGQPGDVAEGRTAAEPSPPASPPTDPGPRSMEDPGSGSTTELGSRAAAEPTRKPNADPDPEAAARPGSRSTTDPASAAPSGPDGRSPDGTDRTPSDPHGSPEPPRGIRQLQDGPGEMGPGALALNVALSQGLFGTLILAGVWLFSIPPDVLGLGVPSPSAVGVGVAFGLALYAANEVGSLVADRLGVGADERLRELLAPDSFRGWVVLLGFALPVAAAVEELLFRAALIGALSAGFGVSPWLLAVGSSVAFGFAHGAQGRGGVVVTGALGLALAAGFVLTGSLLVVFVAHYLVNALEFLVHEGLGIERVG